MKKDLKNIAEQDTYDKDDLDTALDCVLESIEIMNNKPLWKLVKAHAEKKGKQIDTLQDMDSGGIKSIDDLRKKRYAAFKE